MGELTEERVVDETIRFLLDGLGVESLAELKRLVDLARSECDLSGALDSLEAFTEAWKRFIE